MRSGILSSLFLVALAGFSSTTVAKEHWSHSGDQSLENLKFAPFLSESKQTPLLLSGNMLITAHKSQILSSQGVTTEDPSDAPDPRIFTGEMPADTFLRGKLKVFPITDPKVGKGIDELTTAVAFRVPQEAAGKYCSFHFIIGPGDATHKGETAFIYSLDGDGNMPVTDFGTSWVNKPFRNHLVAEFTASTGGKTVDNVKGPADGEDATFKMIQTGPIQHVKDIDGRPAFKCDPIIGETQWELVGVPRKPTGSQPWGVMGTWAWSMNKGLMIEIHDLPAGDRPWPLKDEQKKPAQASRKHAGVSRYGSRKGNGRGRKHHAQAKARPYGHDYDENWREIEYEPRPRRHGKNRWEDDEDSDSEWDW